MAAINDEKTQKFFEKKLNYQAWIGAAAKKVKTEYKNVDFKWLDGSRWNYTNFIPDETTITEEQRIGYYDKMKKLYSKASAISLRIKILLLN